MKKPVYKLDYSPIGKDGYWILKERKRFLFFSWWVRKSVSKNREWVESVYETLTKHKINNPVIQDEEIKCLKSRETMFERFIKLGRF